MLERRAGEDNFKRLQQRLLAVSQNAAASGKGTSDWLSDVIKQPWHQPRSWHRLLPAKRVLRGIRGLLIW